MLFHDMTEWRAPICSADNDNGGFGGDVFGGGGDFGGGQFGSAGGGNSIEGIGGNGDGSGGGIGAGSGGSGDFGLGGPGPMQTTAADYAALGTLAASGALAGYGMSGWSAATATMANAVAASYGTSLDVALGHLAHDIAASMAWGGMGALGSGQ